MARRTVRKQPQRTCIGCQRVDAKRQLIRVVRQPDGRIIVDAKGKAPGRGAYICATRSCWAKALDQGRLERALKVTLTPEQRGEVAAYGQALPEEAAPSGGRAAAAGAVEGSTGKAG
jgi:predicted RNA-binding protein YlxR (DUF448 family)